MELTCEGNVLLVGDGDFSFSLSLLRHSALTPAQVTTSNVETLESIQHHELAQSNMTELKSMGASVLLEVDACELHTHPVVSQKFYSRIIFNFPLADRHNIKKNRALLADFFLSCSQVLSPCGQVMVSLCKGQGGTPADQPKRSWQDSWQIVAMAANAGFILSKVLPFDASQFPEYHSVGFRFQDKSFDTDGSLVHVFEKSDIVRVKEDVVARGTLQHAGETYSCSQYIAEKLERNLIKEDTNPISMVRNELEAATIKCFSPTRLEDSACSAEALIPGHKSRASVCVATEEAYGKHTCDEDALTEMKRQKDADNLSRKKELVGAQFAHGVDKDDDVSVKSSDCKKAGPLYPGLLPDTAEAVFVLVRNTSTCGTLDNGSEIEMASQENGNLATGDSLDEVQADSTEIKCFNQKEQAMNCSTRVFHYRTSLLENLDSVCSTFLETVSATSSLTVTENRPAPGESSCKQRVILAGQCCAPCSIEPHLLPVHHELMFVHRLPDVVTTESSMNSTRSTQCADADFESVAADILSCLQASGVFKNYCSLNVTSSYESFKISIDGFDGVGPAMLINKQDSKESFSPLGIVLKAICGSRQFCVTVLHLDRIICQMRNVPDPRLLWAKNEKVIHQWANFSSSSLPVSSSLSQSLFQPVSWYPMRFAHDLSFWESSSDSDPFDETEMLDVIRYTAQDSVIKVSLVDSYTEPATGRRSRCYRLHFLCHWRAFPYAVSWKLQSQIRIEISRRLGVVLR